MAKRALWIAFFALSLLVLSARYTSTGEIITEMSVPQYLSYEAQAIKLRDQVARDERDFYPAFCGAGMLNGSYVILFRFQPPDTEPINFYGRHFSVLFDSKSDLIGMLRVKPEWAKMSRADRGRAEATAMLFIRIFAPSLWRYTKSRTVEMRDFKVSRDGDETSIIEGVLSLFYDQKRKTYFFVLVAPDGTVMAFERDLPNDAVDFGQAEETWLYDSYLEKSLVQSGQERR